MKAWLFISGWLAGAVFHCMWRKNSGIQCRNMHAQFSETTHAVSMLLLRIPLGHFRTRSTKHKTHTHTHTETNNILVLSRKSAMPEPSSPASASAAAAARDVRIPTLSLFVHGPQKNMGETLNAHQTTITCTLQEESSSSSPEGSGYKRRKTTGRAHQVCFLFAALATTTEITEQHLHSISISNSTFDFHRFLRTGDAQDRGGPKGR